MRNLLFAFIFLLSCKCLVSAQEAHRAKLDQPPVETLQNNKIQSESSGKNVETYLNLKIRPLQSVSEPVIEKEQDKSEFQAVEFEVASEQKENSFEEIESLNKDKDSSTDKKERFHWKPALIQSGVFLGIQHGFRMTQKKTTRQLSGPFFRDWGKSVKGLRGWDDSDNFFTNYVAHPLQGGLTGRIFVNNSDAAKKQEFGKSPKYWKSRFKAMIWSAAWSTQFELGPISEASLGNVGQFKKNGKNTMAWQDLIVTPVVGTGVLVLEDALDKYVLKNWLEKRNSSKFKIRALRIILNPTTSFANVLRWKRPSWREYRPL